MTPELVAQPAVALGTLALGAALARRAGVGDDGADRFAWAAALGAGATSLWVFVLAATGALPALGSVGMRVAATLAPALALGAVDAARARGAPRSPRRRTDPWAVPPTLVALVLGVAAFAPETGFDALVYHLPAAARVARDGLGPMVGLLDGEFRLGFDLLWAPAVTLDGGWPAGAAVHHALAGAGLAAGIFGETRRRAGSAAAGTVTTLWLLSPEVARLSTTAYVDLGVGLPAFLALTTVGRALRAATPAEARRSAALAGVLAGFAANAKSHALLGVPVVAVALLVAAPRDRRRALAACAAAAGALVAAPWVVRSWWNTGNPVLPLGVGRFGPGWARADTVELAARTVLEQTGAVRGLLRAPEAVLRGFLDPAWGYAVPAFVVALLPAAWTRPDTPERRGLLVAGVLAALAWAAFVPLVRFGFGVWALGAVAAGVGGRRLVGARRGAAAVALVVAAALAVGDARALDRVPARVVSVLRGERAPAWAEADVGPAVAAARSARGWRSVGLAAPTLALVGPGAVSLTPQRNGVLPPDPAADPAATLAACRRLGLRALVVPEGGRSATWDRVAAAFAAAGAVRKEAHLEPGWRVLILGP